MADKWFSLYRQPVRLCFFYMGAQMLLALTVSEAEDPHHGAHKNEGHLRLGHPKPPRHSLGNSAQLPSGFITGSPSSLHSGFCHSNRQQRLYRISGSFCRLQHCHQPAQEDQYSSDTGHQLYSPRLISLFPAHVEQLQLHAKIRMGLLDGIVRADDMARLLQDHEARVQIYQVAIIHYCWL